MIDVPTIERMSMRAWPALEQVECDGWVMRAALGLTGRANSVTVLSADQTNLAQRIDRAEAWSAERALPCIFRILDCFDLQDLSDALAGRGYGARDHTWTMKADIDPAIESPCDCVFDRDLPDEWMAMLCRLTPKIAAKPEVFRRLVGLVEEPQSFIAIRRDGAPVAVARVVCEGDWVGLFDVVVDPAWRGQGLGRSVTQAALAWGRDQGASRAYLQVVGDNAVAQTLYASLGFDKVYTYLYRVAP